VGRYSFIEWTCTTYCLPICRRTGLTTPASSFESRTRVSATPGIDDLDAAIDEVSHVPRGKTASPRVHDRRDLGVELADRLPRLPAKGGNSGVRLRRSIVEGQNATGEILYKDADDGDLQS
jgi:hypothetical protein